MLGERITPSRLVVARRRRQLTKAALAQRAGLSSRALYVYESGRGWPTLDSLSAIAEATRFPIPFFYRSELAEPSVDAASFRSLASMTATQRDAALAAGALSFEVQQWIDDKFELVSPKLPNMTGFDPVAAAAAFRNRLSIGERSIGNMVHLLEAMGIRVFSLAEQGKQVDAFSVWHQDIPFVFLNTMKTAEHSRMDAAHELGHLLLHRHGGPQGRDLEKDAQAFAAAFLMPERTIRAQVGYLNAPTLEQLILHKAEWKVSASALAHRTYRLGLMSEWHYRGICIDLARFGRAKEPNPIPRETSQVFTKAFGDLKDDGITPSDLAKELDLYTEDLDALIFGLCITPVNGGSNSSAKRADLGAYASRSQLTLVRDRDAF